MIIGQFNLILILIYLNNIFKSLYLNYWMQMRYFVRVSDGDNTCESVVVLNCMFDSSQSSLYSKLKCILLNLWQSAVKYNIYITSCDKIKDNSSTYINIDIITLIDLLNHQIQFHQISPTRIWHPCPNMKYEIIPLYIIV